MGGEILTSDTSTENRSSSPDIQITRQNDSIVVVHDRILGKEPIRRESLEELLPT